ncbi:hypothetical protein [Thermogemmatispora onikobensis]|uniref:hypothetical protein n=1 Tax=Thermogemmatispora onikobensis TaxID=732234 RepID=UPI00159F070C|nr:hypothetical protein [Thermogemmatispora onikobensis]
MNIAVYRKQLIITICLLIVLAALAVGLILTLQTGGFHHLLTLPSSASPSLQYRYGP